MNKYTLYIIASLSMLIAASCNPRKAYHHYEHTPVSGWEKNERIEFNIPPVEHSGTYALDLGLRINGLYPYMRLALVVEQTVYPPKKTTTEKLNCKLIDERGKPQGRGTNLVQYHYHLNDLSLRAGDSLHVVVRHDMRREILPGISDIGISLTE